MFASFSKFWCFFVLEREENRKTEMITGISGVWFFVQKMAVSWHIFFVRKSLLKPLFYSVWGCTLFGPSCQKREILDIHPKKKILTDNWKAHFWVFLGSGEVARRATSLGPKPSLLFCLFVFCLFLSFLCLNRKTMFVCLFLSFLCLNRKTMFSPLQRAFLFLFECLPLFFLSLFWPPPFHSLSLSLYLSFLSSFPPVFIFCFLMVSWFLSLSFFLFLLCFCLMKRTTSKY